MKLTGRLGLILALVCALLGRATGAGSRWIDRYEGLYGVTEQRWDGYYPFEGTLEFDDDSMLVSWKDAYTLGSLLNMYRATGDAVYLRRFSGKAAAIYPGFSYRPLTSERATVAEEVVNGDFEADDDFSRYPPLPVIANGGFEALASPTLPAHWKPWGNSAPGIGLEAGAEGARCVTVRTNPAAGWQLLEQTIAYTPGARYGVTALAKTSDPAHGARVEVYDYTARAILAYRLCAETSWTRVNFSARMPAAGHLVKLRLYHGHYAFDAVDAFDAVALCDPWALGVLGYYAIPGWTRVGSTPATAHLLPHDGEEWPGVIDFGGRVRRNGGDYRLQLLANPAGDPQAVEQAIVYAPGARYSLRGYGKGTGGMLVLDEASGAELARQTFSSGQWQEVIADYLAPAETGHRLILRLFTDNPVPGAAAQFEQVSIKRHYAHLPHDGQVASQLADFALLVQQTPALHAEFGATADACLRLITEGILPAWEPYWRDLPDGRGTYLFPADDSNDFPTQSYPYNEQLALGRVFIALYQLHGDAACRERAARMATTFKDALRLVNGAYLWHYWDTLLPQDARTITIEDTSHANLDIHFAVLACRAGIVFTAEDMGRFATTFLTRIWNGSWSDPRLNLMIDGSGDFACSARRHFGWWLELAPYDARVRQVAEAIFARQAGELDFDLQYYPHRASFFALTVSELAQWKPLTRVSLTVGPTRVAGTPVTMSAAANGGAAQYRFFVWDGTVWTDLGGYGPAAAAAWTPPAPGSYTLLVWAREVGSPNGWDAYAQQAIIVTAPAPVLSAVRLAATPAEDGYRLTATPTGGSEAHYRFFTLRQGDTVWTQLRRYAPDPTCPWTPPAPGSYTLLVWAREAGHTTTWDAYSTLTVTVP